MKIIFGTRNIENGNETYTYVCECPKSKVINENFGEVGSEGEIGLEKLQTIKKQLIDFLNSTKEPTEVRNAVSDILDLLYAFEEVDSSNNVIIYDIICSYGEWRKD